MIAYITGTSSGIGKALAEQLLEEGHTVIGLSRKQSIQHLNYDHVKIDLSDLKSVNQFDFSLNLVEDVVLVNNAGIIGAIKPIGQHIGEEIIELANVNIIAPQILVNKFINKYQGFNNKYQIVNMSSGAGKHPIDAWSTYCASKAAIDLFSETIAQELKSRNYHNWHVFSIAPGVVDTPMQSEIRLSSPKAFLNRQKFIDLKDNNELETPESVAQKLYDVILDPNLCSDVVFSLHDLK